VAATLGIAATARRGAAEETFAHRFGHADEVGVALLEDLDEHRLLAVEVRGDLALLERLLDTPDLADAHRHIVDPLDDQILDVLRAAQFIDRSDDVFDRPLVDQPRGFVAVGGVERVGDLL
jgi:hypothetical protein